MKKIRRPTISLSRTSKDYYYFLSRWEDYKATTKLQSPECITQLLECCEEQLRRDLLVANSVTKPKPSYLME